jgi:hypothetical protein
MVFKQLNLASRFNSLTCTQLSLFRWLLKFFTEYEIELLIHEFTPHAYHSGTIPRRLHSCKQINSGRLEVSGTKKHEPGDAALAVV